MSEGTRSQAFTVTIFPASQRTGSTLESSAVRRAAPLPSTTRTPR